MAATLHRAALAVGVVALLCGCQTPYVFPKPLSLQSRVDSVYDWERLAYRMLAVVPNDQRFEAVFPSPNAIARTGVGATPLYVAWETNGGSDFDKAFRTLLEKALVQRGYTVVQSPQGAVTVSFSTQSFLYDSDHNSHILESPTALAVTSTIVGQFHRVRNLDTGLGVGLATTPFVDLLATLDDKTDAEVLVSITVGDDVSIADKLTVAAAKNASANRRVLYRCTETLYVKPSDLHFYLSSQSPPVVSLPVRGSETTARLAP